MPDSHPFGQTFETLAEAQLRDLEARKALTRALQEMLEAARPRLLRLAYLQGVPADMVEDVVQESLLAAWHSLHHLHQPDRFDAWLDGICRNISRQHRRASQLQDMRQMPLTTITHQDDSDSGKQEAPDPPDPQAFDPAEELDRQDLQALLSRALGYLSPGAREAVELYYLLEMPQREAALRLGLSIRGLEDRLRRARQQLYQVLSRQLREDAQTFGLAFDANDASGWREARMWCVLCGRRRLRGLFTALSDGTYGLRLRCPECSEKYADDIFSAEKITLTRGLRSFAPACKQITLAEKTYFAQALEKGWQLCRHCGLQVPLQITLSEKNLCPLPEYLWVALPCPACNYTAISSTTSVVCWTDPIVAPLAQRFMAEHPRWIAEPATLATYAGQAAIRMRLLDLPGNARLTIFVHALTLQTFCCFQE